MNDCLRLRGLVGDRTVVHMVGDGETTVGAAADNQLVLADRSVSRKHAALLLSDVGLGVRDRGSKNGTFVNGERVGDEAPLHEGDEVRFGSVVLLVEAVAAGDADLAIAVDSPARPLAGAQSSLSRTPSQYEPTPEHRWLAVLRELYERHPASSPSQRLAQAIRQLGAQAAIVLVRSETATPMVRAAAGPGATDLVAGNGKWTPGLVVEEKRATFTAADGRSRVVVSGDFPGRQQCENLLALLLVQCSPPSPVTAQPRPISGLVLPDGHVRCPSPAMAAVYGEIERVLVGDMPLLITGETGVGKEHVARIVHASSDRTEGPCVPVNCAAIPAELLEAELFGIAPGTATGVEGRDGKLVQARGGVVLLDEIANMSPALQAKLLRALQENEVQPVGARHAVPIDVRFLAATNSDLERLIATGSFRRDLYYRLAGYTLHVPPLRQRRGDIAVLIEHFLNRFAEQIRRQVLGVTTAALDALVRAPWPGNLRELEHEVRRLVYRCPDGAAIDSGMLSASVLNPSAEESTQLGDEELDLKRQTELLERRLITAALARCHGNKAAAARLLGLSRNGLMLKLERLGLE